MHVRWGCPPLDRPGPSTGSSRWTGPHPHPLIRAHPAQGQADYRGVAISSCLSPSASVCTFQCSDPLLSLLSQSLYFYVSIFPSVSFSLCLYFSWCLSVSLCVFVFLRCIFVFCICFSASASLVSLCLFLSLFFPSCCVNVCVSMSFCFSVCLSLSPCCLSLGLCMVLSLSPLYFPFSVYQSLFFSFLWVSLSLPHPLFIFCLSSCVYLFASLFSVHLCLTTFSLSVSVCLLSVISLYLFFLDISISIFIIHCLTFSLYFSLSQVFSWLCISPAATGCRLHLPFLSLTSGEEVGHHNLPLHNRGILGIM